MPVRPLEAGDRMRVVRMLRDAHLHAQPPFVFSAAHVMAQIDLFRSHPARVALVLEQDGRAVGVLLASAQDHIAAPVRYAAEATWWIDPGARGRGAVSMLDAYHGWSREQGCTFCNMVELYASPGAGRLYERLGYRPAETHFIKLL